jgi:hypothetical protein
MAEKFFEQRAAYFHCSCGNTIAYSMVRSPDADSFDDKWKNQVCSNCKAIYVYDDEKNGFIQVQFPKAQEAKT